MNHQTVLRPTSVPEGAVWVTEAGEWRFGATLDGHSEGMSLAWNADGRLVALRNHSGGRLHGPCLWFGAGGAVVAEGRYLHGKAVGVWVYQRVPGDSGLLPEGELPKGVWRLEKRIDPNGDVLETLVTDRTGLPLGLDGAPAPCRPKEVPAEARFVADQVAWRVGQTCQEVDGCRAHGAWRTWDSTGRLRRAAVYDDGRLLEFQEFGDGGELLRSGFHTTDGAPCGVWKRLLQSGATERTTWLDAGRRRIERFFGDRCVASEEVDAAGQLEGAWFEEADASEFCLPAMPERVGINGVYRRGLPVGEWSLVGADGVALWRRNWGDGRLEDQAGFTLLQTETAPPPGQLIHHYGLAVAKGRHYEAILAAVRLAGAGTPQLLRDHLAIHRLPWTAATAHARAETALTCWRDHWIRYGAEALPALISGVFGAMLLGADAAELLRELALWLDHSGRSRLALDCVQAAAAQAPQSPAILATRGLLRINLGDFAGARADTAELNTMGAEEAKFLDRYLKALAAPYSYWPALPAAQKLWAVADPVSPAPTVLWTARDLVQGFNRRVARLFAIRAALAARGLAEGASGMPPVPPVTVPGDLVAAAARDLAGDLPVPALIVQGRMEWFALCLLSRLGGNPGSVATPSGAPMAQDVAAWTQVVHQWERTVAARVQGAVGPGLAPLWDGSSVAELDPGLAAAHAGVVVAELKSLLVSMCLAMPESPLVGDSPGDLRDVEATAMVGDVSSDANHPDDVGGPDSSLEIMDDDAAESGDSDPDKTSNRGAA